MILVFNLSLQLLHHKEGIFVIPYNVRYFCDTLQCPLLYNVLWECIVVVYT